MKNLFEQPFVIAADHGGYDLKQHLIAYFKSKNITNYTDLGQYNEEMSNFPEFSKLAAEAINTGKAEWAIVICGSGIGISMAANRFQGIRCALCHDVTTAKLSRLHNNANMIALGGRLLGTVQAEEIVQTFAETQFLGDRYQARIDLMDTIC